ncbi:MAG TPA: S-layer homology domain-containing protein, partial [Anaerolineales bacterium]|nr:S-layer homology domain-containing protein [Anaerolineales bacterium]
SGFVNNETSSVIDTQPTCTVSGAHSAPGFYPIVCSGGVDNNYAFNYINGTLTVTVNSAPPVISEGASVNVTMSQNGLPIPFALTLNATDPNSDPLTWSIFSQGTNGVAGVVAGPASSTSVSYIPALNFFGTDSFVVQVSDGALTDTITVNVTITAVQTSAPVVLSSTRADPNPTADIHVNYIVTFSTPVSGVDMSDFTATMNGGVVGSAVIAVSGSGSVYTVTVNTGSNVGTIRLDVLDDNSIVDAFSTPLDGGFTSGEVYTIVRKSPIFADVPFSHWANSYIERLYNAGITGGCGTDPLIYCPSSMVTRAQMAVFIMKTINGPFYVPPSATGTVFNDVPSTHWAAAWIEQFRTLGLTAGCGNNNYCPEQVLTTRAQMAVFLLRAKYGAGYHPPVASGTVFNDISADYWAAAWIEQLAAEGITTGCGGGNYCPEAPLSRAEMAVFLVKTLYITKEP